MLMHQQKGRIYHMGDLDLRHSWAYLPDLARAFVMLAERRHALARFENFHFAGHWISHGRMMAAIAAALDRPVAVKPLAWWALGAAGLVDPIMRDIHRMRYLWQNEMELVDPRLDAMLVADPTTPFEQAVKATVDELFNARKAA